MRRLVSAGVGVGVTAAVVDVRLAGAVLLTLAAVTWARRWGRPLAPPHPPLRLVDGYDVNREHLSRDLKAAIFERDGWVCRYGCEPKPVNPLEVDHWWPVAYGGTNRPENLVTLCRVHNRMKGKRVPPLDTVAPGEPIWRVSPDIDRTDGLSCA